MAQPLPNKLKCTIFLAVAGLFFIINTPIASANTIKQINVEEGDAFWYDLTANAPGVVGVSVWTDESLGPNNNDILLISLYDSLGNEINKSTGNQGKASLYVSLTKTDIFKVRVYLYDSGLGSGLMRTITVSSPQTLSTVPHYQGTASNITEGDAVWYSLTVDEIGIVGINTWTDGFSLNDNVDIYLYDFTGMEVAKGSGNDNRASITYLATTTGTFKVQVHLSDFRGGTDTRSIKVSSNYPLGDIPSNSISSTSKNDTKLIEIFKDDFEDKNLKKWDVKGGYEIEYKDGNFVLKGYGHNWAVGGDKAWTNYTFETKLMTINGNLNLNVRLSNSGRYFVSFEQDRDFTKIGLKKQMWYDNGTWTRFFDLSSVLGAIINGEWFKVNEWYTVRIESFDNNIKVYVDNDLKINYTDTNEPIFSGNIAFEPLENSNYYFDDVRVLASAQEWQKSTFTPPPITTQTTISEVFIPQNTTPIPSIVIDGNPNDWIGIEPIMIDPEGDSKNVQGSDLKSLYATKDNDSLYLMLEVYNNPNGSRGRVEYMFEIANAVDSPFLKWDYEVGGDAQGNTWLWNLTEYDTRINYKKNPENPYGRTVPAPSVEAVGRTVFEMKVPLYIIGKPENMIIRARTQTQNDERVQDDMQNAKFVAASTLQTPATGIDNKSSEFLSIEQRDFFARIIAMLWLIISTIIFSTENNRTKLHSYVIAGLSSYAILDLVSGIYPNAIFVTQNDIFLIFGGLSAVVFGILSRDKKMAISLAIIGFVSFGIGFAIFWFMVKGDPDKAGQIVVISLIIWGGIHGIGLGSIYKNLRKAIGMTGASALGFLLAMAFFGIYSKAVIGVGESGNPFGYGIFGSILGAVIGIGMYYVGKTEPEIKPQRPSEPVSLEPSPAHPKTFPSELLHKYTDIEFIGKGGFARVFKVKRRDGRIVALKTPLNPDEETGKSFLREMNVTSWRQLNHRNIVAVFDVNVLPIPYLEIEYMEGGNLESLQKPLEIELACEIVFNIAEGLKYAHELGIIHRDLKPQNILFTKDKIPKITDWGTGRVIVEGKSTTQHNFTPAYAAPEQVKLGKTDKRTDIYQLGVILYNLLTNDIPFKGENIIEIASAIVMKRPPAPSKLNSEAKKVEHIIIKCLSKKKEDRYQSIEELQWELAKFIKEPQEKPEDIREKLQQETVHRDKQS